MKNFRVDSLSGVYTVGRYDSLESAIDAMVAETKRVFDQIKKDPETVTEFLLADAKRYKHLGYEIIEEVENDYNIIWFFGHVTKRLKVKNKAG